MFKVKPHKGSVEKWLCQVATNNNIAGPEVVAAAAVVNFWRGDWIEVPRAEVETWAGLPPGGLKPPLRTLARQKHIEVARAKPEILRVRPLNNGAIEALRREARKRKKAEPDPFKPERIKDGELVRTRAAFLDAVARDAKLRNLAKVLASNLAFLFSARRGGYLVSTVKELAERVQLSERSVYLAQRALVARGYLTIERRPGLPNVYAMATKAEAR